MLRGDEHILTDMLVQYNNILGRSEKKRNVRNAKSSIILYIQLWNKVLCLNIFNEAPIISTNITATTEKGKPVCNTMDFTSHQ